jgi:multisubunit Na+/H+ antiporter MnhF subunit
MNTAALAITALAAILFVARMLRGPALSDRVISVDGFVSTIVIGVTIASARPGSGVVESTVLVVALGGFVGTAILARFIERRGS